MVQPFGAAPRCATHPNGTAEKTIRRVKRKREKYNPYLNQITDCIFLFFATALFVLRSLKMVLCAAFIFLNSK